ncbi:MAG: T9SS type A sorting domain-containing protein, partial [Paludibacteraceae bacterium]|nr:T9SS type A sorting domain-containing protein [Paludibacteraceae bacterium]
DYHGLRHFSKFAPKGYFCVGSTTDNSDLVCTSFVSPDGNKATIVVINKGGNHAVKVNAPFTNCTARLTMTATSKDERSKDYGVIDLANEIEMPKMSIATITFENNGSLDDVKQYTVDETFIATFANDNLQIITSEAANANIEVWDVTGKVWVNKAIDLNAGVNTVEANIPSGVYFVKVSANGKQSVVKCVK